MCSSIPSPDCQSFNWPNFLLHTAIPVLPIQKVLYIKATYIKASTLSYPSYSGYHTYKAKFTYTSFLSIYH